MVYFLFPALGIPRARSGRLAPAPRSTAGHGDRGKTLIANCPLIPSSDCSESDRPRLTWGPAYWGGNSATFGVVRGSIDVGPPALSITFSIAPLSPSATVIM
jgi:hypothetical protein